MECDLNGDSGDAMNSNTSASDRSALYATASRTRSREQIHINSGSHCHDDVDTILRTRSSSVGALHSCQIQPKVSRRERMRKALKLWRLRKRWEKEFDKQRSLPGPFAPVHVKDKRGSIHASLLLLFAVMQCICGFVFPFCDAFALNDTRTLFAVNHKYYLEIFLQSQYVGAILVLAYLQTLIWYYNGFKSKKQRTDRKTHETDNLAENYVPLNRVNKHVIPEESLEPEPNGESDQSRSMVERLRFNFTNLEHRISEASSSRGTDNKNLSWHKEGMNLYLRLGAVGFGLGVMIHDGFNLSSEWELGQPSCHSELWIPKHVLRLIWVLWQTYFVFKYHRIILHVHKFFVRLAFTHLAAVNLCHWIKAVISEISESLKRAEASHTETQASAMVTPAHMLGTQPNWTMETHGTGLYEVGKAGRLGKLCEDHLGQVAKPYLYPLAIEYSLITGTLFYKMLQRVGKKSQNKMTEYPSCNSLLTPRLSDDGSPITNLPVIPSSVSLGETASFRAQQLQPSQSTDDVSRPNEDCRKHTSYRQLLGCKVYLDPECADDNDGHGDHTKGSNSAREQQSRKTCTQSETAKPCRTRHASESYCHRSHTGLFLGLMLFLACVIGVIFSVGRGRNIFDKLFPQVYQHSKIFMLSVSMLACSVALIQTYSMKFCRIKAEESFEYNLLGVGLIGCLTYHMLLFVPSLETVVHSMIYSSVFEKPDLVPREQAMRDTANPVSIEELRGTAMLYLVKCTLEVCQALLQFFFIVEASRRGPCCRNQARIKPGRSAIVFLLINNLALWLMNTFEFRESENQLLLHRQYYGIRTWPVITCCFIPLIIFFRFHSTVCFAQIWSKLYELH